MTNLRELILSLVDSAIKHTDLAVGTTYLMLDTGEVAKPEDVLKAVQQLVDEGELIEIEYILPSTSYRVKSIYFPKGTEIITKHPTPTVSLTIDDSKVMHIKKGEPLL